MTLTPRRAVGLAAAGLVVALSLPDPALHWLSLAAVAALALAGVGSALVLGSLGWAAWRVGREERRGARWTEADDRRLAAWMEGL